MRFLTYAQVGQATLINERELNDSRKIGNEKRAIQQQGGPIRNNNQWYLAPTPYSQNQQNNPQPLQQVSHPWGNPNPNPNQRQVQTSDQFQP